MKQSNMLRTLFLLIVFFLHTATPGFAAEDPEPTPEQKAAKAKEDYRDAEINLGKKFDNYLLVDKELEKITDELNKIGNRLSAAEAEGAASALLTAAGVLSALAAKSPLGVTAATIVSLKNAAETLKNISTIGSIGALDALKQSAYDLETEVIDRVIAVKTQAEKVNTKLQEWEAALPEGESPVFDDETVSPIDVEKKYQSLPQTHALEPPPQPKDTTETISCRGCSEPVSPPYEKAEITHIAWSTYPFFEIGDVKIYTVYGDHGVSCGETRHSTGSTCGGVYFTCPSPYPGTARVCPHDADHRVVGPCPDFVETKHVYAKGSPGEHGVRVVCGSVGVSTKRPDGTVVKQVCEDLVWGCSRHSSHTWKLVEFKSGQDGSISNESVDPDPETLDPETPDPETPETPTPETPTPETPETPTPETPTPETPETPAPETPTPETPAPETPTPETPEGVTCGNTNTGAGACSMGGTASSATAHQTTCLAGHTYWLCNAKAVVTHGKHTAPETPTPVPPIVNPAPVVCPADSLTSCGGTVSHATTCAAGHSYYTCDAAEVVTHSGHTAPVDPDPETPAPETPTPEIPTPETPSVSCSSCGRNVVSADAHQTRFVGFPASQSSSADKHRA